jgi:glyoxylase-like metal-dependent hydrolase (beta-lactamase superfamily II)
MLIDAGIGPRTAATRLAGTGLSVSEVSAICLTHLDRDHFSYNWIGTAVRRRIAVFCAADRVADVIASAFRHASDGEEAEQFARLVRWV